MWVRCVRCRTVAEGQGLENELAFEYHIVSEGEDDLVPLNINDTTRQTSARLSMRRSVRLVGDDGREERSVACENHLIRFGHVPLIHVLHKTAQNVHLTEFIM
jgi:hypothetical protein